MTSADVIVLGGGPAGLAAAHRLAGRGRSVVVIERESRVGGLAASRVVAGQSVDHGSHRLHSAADPELLGLLTRLLGDELQTRPRHGRIRLLDSWIDFPLSAAQVLRAAPLSFTLRAAMGGAAASIRRRDETTFERYVATGLGRPMGELFYFPYAEKMWGLSADELSGTQAKKRISADSPWKILRKLFAPPAASNRSFRYPAGGFGRIPEVLAEAAVSAGAEIRLETRANVVEAGTDSVVVSTTSGEFSAGHLFSTVPLPALARLCGSPIADNLEFRAMVLVYVALEADRFTEFDAHYLPSPDVSMTRLSEPKNYRDGPDPDGVTVLCAEIPCDVGDDVWAAADGDLADRVVSDIARLELGVVAPIAHDVVRVPSAYPIYRLGHEASLQAAEGWVERLPRVVSLGRQGLFAHDNTHHTVAMAWAAVDALTSADSFDEAAWAAARAEFAHHIVED